MYVNVCLVWSLALRDRPQWCVLVVCAEDERWCGAGWLICVSGGAGLAGRGLHVCVPRRASGR